MERWLWYAFLFTVPWQTRLIVWQADVTFSEWRSIAIWLTDFLMIALWVLALRCGWRLIRPDRIDWLLIPLLAAAAVSLIDASALEVGLYQLVRLAQYLLFFFYLRHWAFPRFHADRSIAVFTLGALLQAGIAWGQSVFQHDLGLRVLGETLLTPFLRGVAAFYDAPLHTVLRAYGTLPHPNVLAMVLGLALWGLGWLWLRRGAGSILAALFWVFAGSLLLWAFGLTYARTIAVVWVFGTAIIAIATHLPRARGWPNSVIIRKRIVTALTLTAFIGGVFVLVHLPQVAARMSIHGGDEAVRLRLDYARDALASGGEGNWLSRMNWTGVGIGNFTSWLAEYDPSLPDSLRQPAHSVYLLVYAEIGVFGVFALIAFLGAVFWQAWRLHRNQPFVRISILTVLSAVLLAATWDHFFWTLQQGRILWWLVLALAAGRVDSYNHTHD